MMTQSREPRRLGSSRHIWILSATLVAAVLLAYSNSFPGAFFFDDIDAIVLNESIRDLTNWRAVLWPPLEAGIGGRPFSNLSYAVNYALSGYDPWSYRALNVAIHAAAAVLLFGLTRRALTGPLLRERFGAHATAISAVVALVWALHPIQANVVDYMSQRTEGLMSALYLLTLYAFARRIEGGSIGWLVLATVSCLLGMASKEGMVTAPAVALLYDRTFVSGSFVAAVRRNFASYAGLAAGWVLLGGLMANSRLHERGVGFGLGESGFDYVLTEIRSVVRYLQVSWWPEPLIFDYGPLYNHRVGEIWPSAIVLAIALGASAYAVWRAPALGFAAAWFFILLSPSSSVIPVVQQPYAENRVYLPLAGIVALTVVGAYRLGGRRTVPVLAAGGIALGVGTYLRNPVFQSEIALWSETVAKHPRNQRAENNLGNALLKEGREAEALVHFENALRLLPTYADARNNRGVVLLRQRRPAEALAEFKTAIQNKDRYADAHYNLGEAYLQLRKPAEAIAALETSLKISPKNHKAYNNLGIALLEAGKIQESIAAEKKAIELKPDLAEAHYNLGNSYAAAAQPVDALESYENALRFRPNYPQAHNNAGVVLLRLGMLDQAGTRFQAALAMDPNYADARTNLELVKSRQSNAPAPVSKR